MTDLVIWGRLDPTLAGTSSDPYRQSFFISSSGTKRVKCPSGRADLQSQRSPALWAATVHKGGLARISETCDCCCFGPCGQELKWFCRMNNIAKTLYILFSYCGQNIRCKQCMLLVDVIAEKLTLWILLTILLIEYHRMFQKICTGILVQVLLLMTWL